MGLPWLLACSGQVPTCLSIRDSRSAHHSREAAAACVHDLIKTDSEQWTAVDAVDVAGRVPDGSASETDRVQPVPRGDEGKI